MAPKNQSEINATLACIRKLNRTHSLVHLHANNYGAMLILDDEDIFLPIDADEPNNPKNPEIPSGFRNRKFNNVLTIERQKLT